MAWSIGNLFLKSGLAAVLLLMLAVYTPCAEAQSTLTRDLSNQESLWEYSDSVDVKSADTLLINAMLERPEYAYMQPKEDEGPGWFERLIITILDWLGYRAREVDRTASATLNPIFYVIFAVVLAVIIVLFFRGSFRSLFNRTPESLDTDEGSITDITTSDFDTKLARALDKKRFREAIRLLYLKVLKDLNGRGLIQWRIDKTNGDYKRELAGSQIREVFADFTLIFDYVDYGDVVPKWPMYKQALAKYEAIIAVLGSGTGGGDTNGGAEA